jgi:hypothetical protein
MYIATALSCGLFAGCATDAPGEAPDEDRARAIEQLELSRQALSARGLPLRIIGYAAGAPLDTEDAVRDAKAQLLDGGAIVPAFDGVNAGSLALATIDERMRAFRAGEDAQDVVANLEAMALPLIEAGQQTMDVTWESEGRRFQTRLIHDGHGVVYDHLLSNLAFVEGREPAAEAPPAPAGRSAMLANASRSTRFVDLVIQWVWGGTRGQVQLDHYVISCDGWVSFCDDGGAANAWMSLGSADGETRRNALIYPRISKLAWGYGWATPTASFSISWSYESLSFSASTSGMGSAGKGTGIHTMY